VSSSSFFSSFYSFLSSAVFFSSISLSLLYSSSQKSRSNRELLINLSKTKTKQLTHDFFCWRRAYPVFSFVLWVVVSFLFCEPLFHFRFVLLAKCLSVLFNKIFVFFGDLAPYPLVTGNPHHPIHTLPCCKARHHTNHYQSNLE
jgi:hypothetical protein